MFWNVDVWSEMDRMRRDMDSLFSNYRRSTGATTYPLLNVYDNKDAVIVTAEIPGVSKEDVSITFSDGQLTLNGKSKPVDYEKNMTVVRRERTSGAFEKTLRIPTKIDQNMISASFSDGILTITLPKAEEAKPKTITIEAK